jgi:hypothetical protein
MLWPTRVHQLLHAPLLHCLIRPPDEVAALNARLAKLKDAGTDELREKAELQDALVR